MELSAVLTKDDLDAVATQLTPLRVELSRRPRRAISLARPSLVELVPGAGLRLRGSARIDWEVGGFAVPVVVRTYQFLLVPSVVTRNGVHVLAFEPILETLDFRRIPGFFDERVTTAINEGLASHQRKLAWNFSKTLSASLALPPKVAPEGRFELLPTAAQVLVTASDVRMTVTFQCRVSRPRPSPSVALGAARA